MKVNKISARKRRAARSRRRIKGTCIPRLCVNRTPRHIYVQLISEDGSKILASASTLDKELKGKDKLGGNVSSSVVVGKLIAKRTLEVGVKKVAFDRSGFKYHGRVKALADSARQGGLDF